MGEISANVLDVYSSTLDRDYFGISSVSPCPRETYLRYQEFLSKDGKRRKRDLQFEMLLDDGHYQEAAVISLLKRARYLVTYTGKLQATIHVGRSNIQGHPDGFNTGTLFRKYSSTRMLEIKARNYHSFKRFEELGIEGFPYMQAQVQLYMSAKDLPYSDVESTQLIFKHKETARIADVLVPRDGPYAEGLTKMIDSILVDGEEPKPERNPLCEDCQFYNSCWGSSTVDFTGFQHAELPEASDKWIKGKAYEALGERLTEEAVQEFREAMKEDTKELVTEKLRIMRLRYPRRTFVKEKYIEEFGEDEFNKYCKFSMVTSIKPSIL